MGLMSALEQLYHQLWHSSASDRHLVANTSDILVFCIISAQRFVHIGTAENQQPANLASDPGQKLGKHVSQNHSQARLEA